jgi:hypothetical protein
LADPACYTLLVADAAYSYRNNRQKNPDPHISKFVRDVGIGVEQNIFPLRTTRTYPREKAVVVERQVDGRRK